MEEEKTRWQRYTSLDQKCTEPGVRHAGAVAMMSVQLNPAHYSLDKLQQQRIHSKPRGYIPTEVKE